MSQIREPTPAQKIAELVCHRSAAKDKKTLPPKFWNSPEFGRNFRLQLIKANALLKIYSATAILNALNSKEGERIWSLTAKWLDPIISKEEKKYQNLLRQQEDYILKQAALSFEEENIVLFSEKTLEDCLKGKVNGLNELGQNEQKSPEKPKSLLEKLD